MSLISPQSSMNSHDATECFREMAEQLKRSQRGRLALSRLAHVCDDWTSLDCENQTAILYLVRGIFTHPGSSRDVIKWEAKA